MIAKVIVDVPLMQTDKPYSYEIPSEFRSEEHSLNSSHITRSRMPSSA